MKSKRDLWQPPLGHAVQVFDIDGLIESHRAVSFRKYQIRPYHGLFGGQTTIPSALRRPRVVHASVHPTAQGPNKKAPAAAGAFSRK